MSIPKARIVRECTADLVRTPRYGASMQREANGAIELAFMRGYQAGYEQALRDAKAGDLNPHYAMEPNRALRQKS